MNKLLRLLLICLLLVPEAVMAQIRITMEQDGGVYKVPCTVNGLKLKFIFDTGASTVSISSTIAGMMLENDYLKKSDIVGSGASVIADGSIVDHTRINLREIEIGGLLLHNVEAVVIHNQDSPLLLGLSAIRQLGKVSISGNILTIDSYSASSFKNADYSLEELSQLYQEALDYYSRGSYVMALENFDILYRNGYLLEYDMNMYANCLDANKRYQDALDAYLSIEDWTKRNDPESLGTLYEGICSVAYWAGQYKTSVRYGELALSNLNVLNYGYYLAIYWLSCSYKELGDMYTAQSTLENYLKKYYSAHGISATDCWTKNYRDNNIATTYRSIGYLFETYGEAKKYMIISAAWGCADAIETCNEFLWDYSTRPYEYVY